MKRFRTCFVVQATLKTGNKNYELLSFFKNLVKLVILTVMNLFIFGIYL